MIKNIAIIPARKNSKGIKFKNRIFFNNTAKFVSNLNFIDKTIVSSDDKIILKKAHEFNFQIHYRKKKYSGDKVSIKKTLLNLISEINLNKNDNLWLFYIPFMYRKKIDYLNAKNITKKKNFKSFCSFINIDYSYHPYYSWYFKKKRVYRYIKNDCFRRQDLPKAFTHNHYLSCFKVGEVKYLSSELINKETIPIFLSDSTRDKLIEIDSKKDMLKFYKNNV